MPDLSVADIIRRLLAGQLFGTLATACQGAPYTSLVAFCASDDLRRILFATHRGTRKFANLAQENRASLLATDAGARETDLVEAAAVSALGRIRELAGETRQGALSAYLRRHPHLEDFAGAPSCALMALEVERFILVRHFQEVHEYRP